MLLALILSSVVFDEANVLNASQRAELEVAAEDSTLVAVIDSSRGGGSLDARLASLSHQPTSVVVFDVATGCGALLPFTKPADPHAERALTQHRHLLCNDTAPWRTRLARATSFVTALGPPHPALAPPPPAPPPYVAPAEPVMGYVFVAALVLGAVVRFARRVLRWMVRRSRFEW